MTSINHLLELCTLFIKEDSLANEVRLAHHQPLNYLNQFKEELQERGVEKPLQTLPWLALVDGLQRRGFLQELDWKDDAEEVINTVLQLTKSHKNHTEISTALMAIESYADEDIEAFIPTLNRELEQHNLQLVWLDIDSDSYPLTILFFNDLPIAKELAVKAGYGIIKK